MAKQYWIFRFDNKLNELVEGNNIKLSWKQKRRFAGRQGDEAIQLYGDYFLAQYLLDEVELKENVDNNKTSIWDVTISLKLLHKFEEPKNRQDYLYSFPRIKSFGENVYKHFRNKYYRMTDVEYEAVINDDIFVSRTLLGTAINSLHQDHKFAFISYLVAIYPEAINGTVDFDIVAQELINYLQTSIITQAKCLQQAVGILKEFVPEEVFTEIAFHDNSKRRNSSNINRQSIVLDQYLPIISQLENLLYQAAPSRHRNSEKEQQISLNNNSLEVNEQFEKRFERIFKNKYLPIEFKS